jgi:hypothetical protein
MITVSLKQILAGGPCSSGWAKVLHARGKITKDQMDSCIEDDHVPTSLSKLADDEQFAMSSIIESNSLNDCIWTFKCVDKLHYPLRRKFAVWCARQVQHLMKDQSINALDVAWLHSEGFATDEELAIARRAAAAAADADAYAAAAYAAAAAAAADAYAAAYAAAAAAYAADAYAAAAADAAAAAYAADAAAAAYAADAYADAAAAYAADAYAAAAAAADADAYAAYAREKQRIKLKQILDAGHWVD